AAGAWARDGPRLAAVRKLLRSLAAIRRAAARSSLYPRVIFLVLSLAAMSPLGAAYADLLPLPTGARFFLLPAMLVLVVTGVRHAEWGRRALVGYIAGIIATRAYAPAP